MKAKKKGTLPLIDKIFLWINGGLCLALLISYLAPVTDPRKAWIVAFFGLAYPPILLTNVLMIVFWALRRKWFALISVITILCGFGVLKNNIGFHPGNRDPLKPTDTNNVRLMTYNVHSFKKYGAANDVSTRSDILSIISGKQPDVIGIEEFFSRKKGRYAMADSIKKIIGSDNCYIGNFSGNDTETDGIAIFSKWPIIAKGIVQLTDIRSSNQCIYIDIKKDSRIIRFYAVHLQSIKFDPEDYRYIDTVTKSGKADISSTRRLGGKLKKAFLLRAEQVAKIKEHATRCQYPYIIAGDFNDTPTSYAVNQMAKGLKNAFREKGFGLGRTYNGDFPNYQIDYIMANKQLDVASYTIIEKKLSDHFPVYADLVLR